VAELSSLRIKICGLTRIEDVRAAVHAGADALGFVFYPPSPRYVEPAHAASLLAAIPPFVQSVGLFVDAPPDWIREVLAICPLDLLQFHGDEPAEACVGHGRPYLKAVRMRAGVDLLKSCAEHPRARGLLLDAYVPGVPGGTGERFDWDMIPPHLPLSIVLSGGLTPGNIVEAVSRTRPWAVDVSSGVEIRKGIKDAARLAQFISQAKAA
jgi:phosphoribosylanthranilate isomerase